MQTILLTGATDGIGLALAHHYHKQGCRLILIGRRALTSLQDPIFTTETYCRADLADSHCTAQISAWLHDHQVTELNLVLHNAALGYVGKIAEQSPESIRDLMQVNLWTPIALSHLLFPYVARAKGKFGFISSVVAGLPGPDYAVYTATKTALEGFVRSWRVELAAEKSPIRLQLLRPGATRTNMHEKSGADPGELGVDRFPAVERVALALAAALAGNQPIFTVGMSNRILYRSGHTFPNMLDGTLRRFRKHPTTPPSVTENVQSTRHCVITGAADGIGRALAHAFAAAGYSITGIDIDEERANAVATALATTGSDIHFIQADLAALETLPQIATAFDERPPIDVLIHNAGISAVGPFVDSNLARQQAVLAINFTAPLLLTTALLQQNRLSTTATYVFLSSLSHYMSYPGATVYAASKDGVASYARSLHVANPVVDGPRAHHVLTVFPGPTRTAHARRYSPDNSREAKRMSPEVLAQLIFKAVHAKRRTLIPGVSNRAAALVGNLLPPLAEQLMQWTIYDRLR